MTDPNLLTDPDSWRNTIPDIPVVSGEPEPDLTRAIYVDDAVGHRRSGQFPLPAIGAIITTAIIGAGVVGYASHRTPHDAPVTNVTTTLLPRPTVTRPGHTVRLPGPTVTRHLRSLVTVRATRTVPGPTVTVTATPTPISGPADG